MQVLALLRKLLQSGASGEPAHCCQGNLGPPIKPQRPAPKLASSQRSPGPIFVYLVIVRDRNSNSCARSISKALHAPRVCLFAFSSPQYCKIQEAEGAGDTISQIESSASAAFQTHPVTQGARGPRAEALPIALGACLHLGGLGPAGSIGMS